MLKIRDWDKVFENHKSREVVKLGWVRMPNSHDGSDFIELMEDPDGLAHYGVWSLIVQIASKCTPRGSLVRSNGIPHTAETMAKMVRANQEIFRIAITRLISIGWILDDTPTTPRRHPGDTPTTPRRHPGDTPATPRGPEVPFQEKRGEEIREEKRREGENEIFDVQPEQNQEKKPDTALNAFLDQPSSSLFENGPEHSQDQNPLPAKEPSGQDKPASGKAKAWRIEDSVIPPILANEPKWASVWSDWIAHRKEIKHPLKETSTKRTLDLLAGMAESEGFGAVENAIWRSIASGWRGIFPERGGGSAGAPRGTRCRVNQGFDEEDATI